MNYSRNCWSTAYGISLLWALFAPLLRAAASTVAARDKGAALRRFAEAGPGGVWGAVLMPAQAAGKVDLTLCVQSLLANSSRE